jgi:hypothetical protein
MDGPFGKTLVELQDLLDHDVGVWRGRAQSGEVRGRMPQAVDVIDPHALKVASLDESEDQSMRQAENLGVLRAQRSEIVDGEEPSVVDLP